MIERNVAEIPPTVQKLVDLGIRIVNPSRVILFGSRAKGAPREDSDFDLAFVFPPENLDRWRRFLAAAREEPITLRPTDLVNWSAASDSLKRAIEAEGIVIYERTQASNKPSKSAREA